MKFSRSTVFFTGFTFSSKDFAASNHDVKSSPVPLISNLCLISSGLIETL